MVEVLLVAASFVTAAFTAVMSVGGGIMLLALMATLLPPVVVIPVHAAVMSGNNFSRALFMRTYIDWRGVVAPFAVGSIVGVTLGAHVVSSLPSQTLLAILGVFILVMVWLPSTSMKFEIPYKFTLAGIFISFCAMFIGAGGILLGAFFSRDRMAKEKIVATHAAAMVAQHAFKVIAFATLGFSFADYLPLIIAMIASGFAGSWVGRYALRQLPERWFRPLFKVLITLLALRLLIESFVY